MKSVSSNPSIKTTTIVGGVKNAGKTGGAKKVETKKVVAPSAKGADGAPQTQSVGGVKTTTKADGSFSKETDSGVSFSSNSDGSKSVSLPGANGGSFKVDADGNVQVTGGDAKKASFVEDESGAKVLGYEDKKGNQVFLDTDTMSYSVEKWSSVKQDNFTAQIFDPDGTQHVHVHGTDTISGKQFDKIASFGKDGTVLSNEDNISFKNGKIEFDLPGGKTSRPLLRPLPGQPEQVAETPKPTAQKNAAPTSLLAEQPMLLTGPDQPLLIEGPKNTGETVSPKETTTSKEAAAPTEAPAADPAKAAADAAKAERKQRLDALRDVGPDFFVPEKNEDAGFAKTPSGVIKRMDEDSIAFSLPTGDQFRTDGELVAVLGDNPRAKNARIVTEDDGRTLLAFKDKNRNSYQLDVNSGDLQVSNADGTIRQKLNADGSESIEATSVHTTEAGSVRTSKHSAQFDADGKLVSKSGFDDLKTGSKHLEYTLPNGNPTVRNLLMETKGKAEPPQEAKAAPSFDPETQAMVDSILGKATTPPAADLGSTQKSESAGPINPDPFNQPPTTVSGVTRKTLPDGSVQTSLPSGVTFTDNGEKATAKAADGSTLEVVKREVPSQGGYILYAKNKDGVGYTIAPEHLDYIAESKDGKVHQLLREDGGMLTSITDGERQHVHQFDRKTNEFQCSPGVYADIRTPGNLYVQDHPQNRNYELPVAFPLPPGHQPQPPGQMPPGQMPPGQQPPQDFGTPNPNIPGPGVKPSFWDKVKGWFGAGPAAHNHGAPPPPGHNVPPQFSGMPSSHHHYDPVADQMKAMRTANNVMMGVNIASVGLTALSLFAMPSMMYPYGGMYGW